MRGNLVAMCGGGRSSPYTAADVAHTIAKLAPKIPHFPVGERGVPDAWPPFRSPRCVAVIEAKP